MSIDLVAITLQVIASTSTVICMWLMGNRSLLGPCVGMVSEGLWLAVIVYCGLWGILPLTVFLIVVNTRNFMKWRRDAPADHQVN